MFVIVSIDVCTDSSKDNTGLGISPTMTVTLPVVGSAAVNLTPEMGVDEVVSPVLPLELFPPARVVGLFALSFFACEV